MLIPHPYEKTSRYTVPSRRAARVVPWRAPEHATVYFLVCKGHIKVGITNRKLRERVAQMKCGNPFPLEIVASKTLPYAEAIDAERRSHLAMEYRHIQGEWFRGGKTVALYYFHKIVIEGRDNDTRTDAAMSGGDALVAAGDGAGTGDRRAASEAVGRWITPSNRHRRLARKGGPMA